MLVKFKACPGSLYSFSCNISVSLANLGDRFTKIFFQQAVSHDHHFFLNTPKSFSLKVTLNGEFYFLPKWDV